MPVIGETGFSPVVEVLPVVVLEGAAEVAEAVDDAVLDPGAAPVLAAEVVIGAAVPVVVASTALDALQGPDWHGTQVVLKHHTGHKSKQLQSKLTKLVSVLAEILWTKVGIVPVRKLSWHWNVTIEERLEILAGMVPVRKLSYIVSSFKLKRFPIFSGIVPSKLLVSRSSSVNAVKEVKASGMVPLKSFS